MDFRLINTTDGLELGTTLERYERNMQAIRIAKSDSAPSPEELGLLARYVGWGDSQVYKEFNSREHPVKSDLSLAERRAIDASIINAHYTDVPVIATMWKLLEHLGFGKRNDLTILDPSAGASGLFKSAAPDWAFMSKWMEIELDIVSGKILKKLHPASDVRIQGFQDLNLPDDYQFDLAVTNVPFADVGIHWKNIYGSIHNFFLMKTASMLREGGVMAMLTSRYSLDSSNNEHLYFLQKHG
ncbi:MAG: hypothetical protein NT121_21015, partial [Chloroflexi bacterium]|nr:hypothetical protein [Chloroflexota bacterium]